MYDPKNPPSIFDGDNLVQFLTGMNNAYALKHGLGGTLDREDVGICMKALSDTEDAALTEA